MENGKIINSKFIAICSQHRKLFMAVICKKSLQLTKTNFLYSVVFSFSLYFFRIYLLKDDKTILHFADFFEDLVHKNLNRFFNKAIVVEQNHPIIHVHSRDFLFKYLTLLLMVRVFTPIFDRGRELIL